MMVKRIVNKELLFSLLLSLGLKEKFFWHFLVKEEIAFFIKVTFLSCTDIILRTNPLQSNPSHSIDFGLIKYLLFKFDSEVPTDMTVYR